MPKQIEAKEKVIKEATATGTCDICGVRAKQELHDSDPTPNVSWPSFTGHSFIVMAAPEKTNEDQSNPESGGCCY